MLKDLSLWDKRHAKIMELSGGMKRRVLIAKALSHEPEILFLDEPTAGVDVSLRRDMWKLVHRLREKGTTIILTTHYIEEAEEMADRVGVIDKGKLILVEEKSALMKKLGKRQMLISLQEPMAAIPPELDEWHLELEDEGKTLRYIFDAQAERTGIPSLLRKLGELHIGFKDLETSKSSLEDIFVDLVEPGRPSASEWRRGMSAPAINTHGIWAIYRFEMARSLRTLWQSLVTPVITTALYFVVFGGAIGSRMQQVDGVGYGSFIVPGLIMLVAADAEHLQCVDRHLFPQIHRHDLRTALGARHRDGDGGRLCRRGGDQVDRARPDHPRDLRLLRAAACRASVRHAGVPGADQPDLQPVRLHHRHLGQGVRAARRSCRRC